MIASYGDMTSQVFENLTHRQWITRGSDGKFARQKPKKKPKEDPKEKSKEKPKKPAAPKKKTGKVGKKHERKTTPSA